MDKLSIAMRARLDKFEGVGGDSRIFVKNLYGGDSPEFEISIEEFVNSYLEWRSDTFYGFKRGASRLSVLTPNGFIGIRGAIVNPSDFFLLAKFISPQYSGRKISEKISVACGTMLKNFNTNSFVRILDVDKSMDLNSLRDFNRDCRGIHVHSKLSKLKELQGADTLISSFKSINGCVVQDEKMLNGVARGVSINLVLESTVYNSYYANGIEIKSSEFSI